MRSLLSLLMISCLAVRAQPASTERIGIENDYAKINAEAEKASSIPLMPAAEIGQRDGMPNLFAKLDKDEHITIAYYGASITAGPGWRIHTLDWFRKTWPKAKISEHNASLGCSGSLVGVFRADDDLVAQEPDAVFIEFSLNDVADVRDRPAEVAGALEGIIRKLWMSKPDTDICLVYTLHSSAVDLLNQGKFSASVSLHESIAEHYRIPCQPRFPISHGKKPRRLPQKVAPRLAANGKHSPLRTALPAAVSPSAFIRGFHTCIAPARPVPLSR